MKCYSNDIYPINLVLSYDAESVNEHYTHIDGSDVYIKPTSEAVVTPMTRRTKDYYAMAVGIIFNVPITPKLAAHEGFHAAWFIMTQLNIPLTEYSDEAWAYLIGWVAECIDNFKNYH